MRVCILSMQRVPNFGSLLQAYSLKRLLEGLGHEVSFLDIEKNDEDDALLGDFRRSSINEREDKGSLYSKLLRIDKYAINRIHTRIRARLQNEQFEVFRTDVLGINAIDNKKMYDVCIIGSDEVFNCMQFSPWGFTSQLFGNVSQAKSVITYAASCGATTYSELSQAVRNKIKEVFLGVTAFSTRDANTEEFVHNLSSKEVSVHYDPVLLYNFDEDIMKCTLSKALAKRYCVIYSYPNRIHDKDDILAIQAFCKVNALSIVSVGATQMWIKNHLVLTPFEMLAVFRNAEFVITDTFHGTILSAKYAKRFATMARPSNRNKLIDFVTRIHIEKHLINDMSQIADVYKFVKEQVAIDNIIDRERKRTLAYLEDSIVTK